MGVCQLEFKIKPEFLDKLEKQPWLNFIPEFAQDPSGQIYMRKRGSLIIYKQIKNKNKRQYICIKCGAKILSSDISHLIWNHYSESFDLEKCVPESIPYCPNCEKIPEYVGKSIRV